MGIRMEDRLLEILKRLERIEEILAIGQDAKEIIIKKPIISQEEFEEFLKHLNNRDKLIAKFIYWGGNQSLYDVLSLNIESVDIVNFNVKFKEDVVISYPKDVLLHVLSYVYPRSDGRVFVGRGGANLNPSTVFRSFNRAAKLAGINEFTVNRLKCYDITIL